MKNQHITNFLNMGNQSSAFEPQPAFTGNGSFEEKIFYGQFGPLVMGEGWVSHHGEHKVERRSWNR